MEFGYEPTLDADAELATDRIIARMREGLARVPLRSAFVDALAVEARPAVQALLFALATDRAEDPNSLEHHETTAMVALLGRSFAFDGTTPTGAAAVIPAMLGGFRLESLEIPEALVRPLELVFLEGYVRGREERVRVEAGARALESVVLTRVAANVGLVVLRGAHESEPLTTRLESIAREAFALELAACIVDLAPREPTESTLAPALHFAELVRSVGIEVILAGPGVGAMVDASVPTRDSVLDGIAVALGHAGLSIHRDRTLPRALRELLRARGGPRRGSPQ